MRHTIPPKDFYKKTRNELAKRIPKNGIAYFESAGEVYRTGDQFYPFRQDANFFYLTGIEVPNCKLVIYPDKPMGKTSEILFIPRPDPKKEIWEGKMLSIEKASQISGIETVSFVDNFRQVFNQQWLKYADSIAVCHHDFPEPYQIGGTAYFVNEIREQFPGVEIHRLNRIMAEFRMVKHHDEIEQIRKAIAITKKGFDTVIQATRPGIWEFEIEALIKKVFLENRSHGEAYSTIVGSGKNAATLHYIANNCQIHDGDLVLIDAGADFGCYSADITRTFPANGTFSDRQGELYAGLLEIQQCLIKKVKPGVMMMDLNKQAKEITGNFLKSVGLIDDEKDVEMYFMHNLGHHLGIDTHDLSLLDRPLVAGNVITIEPGIYIPEENIGIRIEDDILVTENGSENLSSDINKIFN